MDVHRPTRRDLTLVPRVKPWLTIIVVVLSGALLVGAPITLRAGSSVAHPHTLQQVMADAADGRLDHHAPHPTALQFSWDAGPAPIEGAAGASAVDALNDAPQVVAAEHVVITLTSLAALVVLLSVVGDSRNVRRGEWRARTLHAPWFAVADDPPPRLVPAQHPWHPRCAMPA